MSKAFVWSDAVEASGALLFSSFGSGRARFCFKRIEQGKLGRIIELTTGLGLEYRFDGAASVWTSDVPSKIAVSAELRYFVWYRDGVPLQVVEAESGRRAELPPIPRTMSAVVAAAFSPYERGKLAVTLTPEPNQVTVYEIR